MKLITPLLLLFTLNGAVDAWPALPLGPDEIEVEEAFYSGNEAVAYLEDTQNGRVFALNSAGVRLRHPPFSTFKIPNFLIALETQVATSPQAVIPYSASRHPKKSFWPGDWAQDQTLESAFRRSAVWAFQDIASSVGDLQYLGYLKHFHYGNEVAKGNSFWLNGALQISPKEQVDFLRKLLSSQYEVAPLSITALKKAAKVKSQDGFTLYGKTGSGPSQGGGFEGWFVGWLERPQEKPVLFSVWTKGKNYAAIRQFRQQSAVELLKRTGYLPLNW